MNRLQRAAVLTALADELRKRRSWCGETHLQKATYFLQALLGVPLGYEFILYKHGPYSFDLHDELTALRRPVAGTSPAALPLRPFPAAHPGERRLPGAFLAHSRCLPARLDFAADKLADKGVADLERLATALFVTREIPDGDAEVRALRINQLKPHVSLDEARTAVATVDRVIQEAKTLVPA